MGKTSLIKVFLLGIIFITFSSKGFAQDTWYSYKSGNWNDPTVWTLDGSVAPIYDNPSSEIPGTSDIVYVTSGKTVTVNINSISIDEMNVIGIIDIANTSSHNFNTIRGTGKIRIAGSGGAGNFPAGTSTDFADPSSGGTLETYGGTSFTLDVTTPLNNLNVAMNPGVALVIDDDTDLNGSLTVTQGIFQINDNLLTSNLTITIQENIVVESAGEITTGSGNARHQLDLYGDLTNNSGTIAFTNRVAAIPGSEATDGIVDVNFLNTLTDQNVVCNGIINFYRVEINKGSVSKTLNITANSAGNFNLFGFADENHSTASSQLASNDNALGLVKGTVSLGTDVSVPTLSIANDYVISEAASISVDGGSLTKDTGNSLAVFGFLSNSGGTITVDLSNGVVLKDLGTYTSWSGSSTFNQLYSLSGGAVQGQTFSLRGGTVTVTGVGRNNTYFNFDLQYATNTFNTLGGELYIYGGADGTNRGVRIKSDPDYNTAQGGTMINVIDNNGGFDIDVNAQLWNFTMRSTTILASFTLQDDITALNDFILESDNVLFYFPALDPNTKDMSIGRRLEIQSGATFLPAANTISFIGSLDGEIDLDDPANTQQVANWTVVKDNANATVRILNGRTAPNTALQVNGELRVESGNFDYGSFNVDARGDMYVSDTLGMSGSTGKLSFDGLSAQTITSNGGVLYNTDLDNSNDLTLVGDLSIAGTLTMVAGVFDIGSNKLTIDGTDGEIVDGGGGFDENKMIKSNGLFGDGGLEWYVHTNETITFPVGTAADVDADISPANEQRYTPAVMTISNFSDDGYVRMIVADGVLAASKDPTKTVSYSWRVKLREFTTVPTVVYNFTYSIEDEPSGSWNQEKPSKVAGGERCQEVTGNINTTTRVITFDGDIDTGNCTDTNGAGFDLEDGQYTAAKSNAFNGKLRTYRTTRSNSNILEWDDQNGWVEINGDPSSPKYPVAGDIAIISSDGSNWHRVVTVNGTAVASVQFDNSTPFGDKLPQIDVVHDHTVDFGEIFGEGHLRYRVDPSDVGNELPNVTADLDGYLVESGSIFEYNATAEGGFDSPSTGAGPVDLYVSIDSYPILKISATVDNPFGSNYPFTFSEDITASKIRINDGGYLITNDGTNGNITVSDSLVIGDGTREGFLQFHSGTDSRQFTVQGHIELKANSDIDVEDVSNSVEHRLIAYQNIKKSSTSVFSTQNTSADAFVELELTGSGTHTFSNDAVDALDLYRVIMNKGTDTTSTFTINSDLTFSANAGGTTEEKPIVLTNGLLIFNDADINETVVSGSEELLIPSTSGMEIIAGEINAYGVGTGIRLDGLLRISGGTLDLYNGIGTSEGHIRFSNTGAAKLEITSGVLDIASSLRRDIASSSGVLTYIQKDGDVRVGVNAVPVTTRGTFEVLGTGSQFTHTGGSLTVVRGNSSTTAASIYIDVDTYDVTATLTIGDLDTPSDGFEKNIGIYSTIPLAHLDITQTNDPQVLIYDNDLTLTGDFTVAGPLPEFNTNGFNFTLGGDFTDNGIFTQNSGTITFNSTSAQQISGTSSNTFYNLLKTGAGGTLTLAKDITINNDLTVASGTLDDANNTITLLGNALIQGTHASTGYDGTSEGLKFAGASEQTLDGNSSSTVSLGAVTISNANNVTVPANGYNFNIDENLDLDVGIFDVGSALLTVGTSADITGTFSSSTFIATNSSFTDNGVKKQFADNVTTDFTFPVGELYYTPVTFEFSGGTSGTSTDGINPTSILVRPAREPHPSVNTENCPTGAPAGTSTNCPTDLDNVLQYYWVIDGDNITGLNSDVVLQYDQNSVALGTDVGGDPYLENEYVGARFLFDNNPSNSINKPLGTVDDSNNEITIAISGTDEALSGDYFAGIESSLPSNIASYETTGGGGDVDDPTTFNPLGGSPALSGAPIGSIIIVRTGDELTFNVDDISLYSTEIEAGATLTIDETERHRIGVVTGEGTLKLVSNSSTVVLPAGLYIDFFNCSGGSLEYAGTGSYEIMGGISLVRNLIISDSGTKTLPSNDITICEDLSITGGDLQFSSAITLDIGDDLLISGGSYNHQGTLIINDDLNISGGTFSGGTGGDKTISGDFILSAGTFSGGSAGTTNIEGNLNYSAGTFTAGSNTASMVLNGSIRQTITGNFTGAMGFFRLEIDNSNDILLAGDVDITNTLTLTNGLIEPAGNAFTLESGAVVATGADGRRRGNINSYVNGRLYKVFSAVEQTASASNPFIFPIGSSSRWMYCALSNVSGASEWYAEYFHTDPTNEANPNVTNLTIDPASSIVTLQNGEYWRIEDIAGGGSANVGLSWDGTSNVSAITEERERLVVMQWDTGNSYWITNGGQSFSAGHSQTQGDFMSVSTVSFSPQVFTLGSEDANNPLPITLVDFEGYEVVKGIDIYWSTASEFENDYFELEYSATGEDWEKVAIVQGAGTSNEFNEYSYLHRSPRDGNNYYRLKQVDFSGEFSYSDIINVNIDKPQITSLELMIYPNPVVNREFRVEAQLMDVNEPFDLHIYDERGSRLYAESFVSSNQNPEITLTRPAQEGIYFIHLVQGKFIKTTRIIVLDR